MVACPPDPGAGRIDGLERIRFTTSHPNDMDDDLIEAHGDLRQADALPASAGAGRVGPHPEGDEPQAHRRKLCPPDRAHPRRAARSCLSGDFIVGFPGETEADFQATLDLVEEVGYGQRLFLQVFARPGTPAAERAQVDPRRPMIACSVFRPC
jgi:tRNA-2-methylthio-N6-dimethylallyladenosine synthase